MSSDSNIVEPVGERRFVLVAGIVLIGANLRASITSLGPVLPDIQIALHLDGTAAGVLNALPLLLFAVLSLGAPRLARHMGIERTLAASVITILAGTLIRSIDLTGAIWIGTVILSAGIACGNVLLPGLVKRDFPTRAAGIIGLYAAAMAGTAGLAAGLAVPIARLPKSDWRWSIGIWALLSLVTLVVWIPQVRGPQHRMSVSTGAQALKSPWRHAIGWQVSLFFACHSLVFYAIVDWFSSYVVDVGISPATSGLYLLVYQVVAVATNLGGASLIHRLSDQRLLGFGCGMLLLIGTTGLMVWPKLSLVWLICAGFGAGLAMVTSLTLFALRTHDHHQASALSGMAQFVGYAGSAAGPLLVGVLHDATGNWTTSFRLLIAASGLVVVFATLAGRPKYID